jgi:hypothetical protein
LKKMADKDEKLFVEISKRLPRQEDKDLLTSLLDTYRTGGKEAVDSKIEEMIKKLVGE